MIRHGRTVFSLEAMMSTTKNGRDDEATDLTRIFCDYGFAAGKGTDLSEEDSWRGLIVLDRTLEWRFGMLSEKDQLQVAINFTLNFQMGRETRLRNALGAFYRR